MRHRDGSLLCFGALLLWAAPALADLMPPGARVVDHAVVIEGAEAWPEHRFYLFPVGTSFDGVEALTPDASGRISTGFYHASPPYLFALPADKPEWATLERLKPLCSRANRRAEGIHRSRETLIQIRLVDEASDVVRIESHYVIEAIGDGAVELRHTIRKRTAAQISEAKAAEERAKWLGYLLEKQARLLRHPSPLLLLSLLGLTGVIWLRRQRLKDS